MDRRVAAAAGVAAVAAAIAAAVLLYDAPVIVDIEGDPDAGEAQQRLEQLRNSTQDADTAGSAYDASRPREWQTSGPFQIDRVEYAVGESVFLRMGVVPYSEKGQAVFLRPLNETHESVYIRIPFDGTDNAAFNQYFKPSLSRADGICDVGDLEGPWRVVFQNSPYEDIRFSIDGGVFVPGEERHYEPVC